MTHLNIQILTKKIYIYLYGYIITNETITSIVRDFR